MSSVLLKAGAFGQRRSFSIACRMTAGFWSRSLMDFAETQQEFLKLHKVSTGFVITIQGLRLLRPKKALLERNTLYKYRTWRNSKLPDLRCLHSFKGREMSEAPHLSTATVKDVGLLIPTPTTHGWHSALSLLKSGILFLIAFCFSNLFRFKIRRINKWRNAPRVEDTSCLCSRS